MSRILLAVSGGIAAYKALEFVRLATGAGHSLRVLQTPSSRRFVGEASFAALSGAPVLVGEFQRDPLRGAYPGQEPVAHEPIAHLRLAAGAEVYLVAPASANTIAKLAGGFAEDMLSACALAVACPVLLAPAMNSRMYEHPATQANLAVLRERGVRILEPGSGRLASVGEEGVGRMAEPERLLAACEQALADPHAQPRAVAGGGWSGLNVLVTAGGTREPIDSVRFIGNSSSGRMGLALARAARDRGAQVSVIAANVALERPHGMRWHEVGSAAELKRACEQEFPACDVLLMAAAVADFTPSRREQGKIKKGGRPQLTLKLEATDDVLASLAARRRDGQTLVGFAAEHGSAAANGAREKLVAKGLDALVVNDIARAEIGFDSEQNEVTVLAPGAGAQEPRSWHVPRASKDLVAGAILDIVESLRASG
jgi:phosphopantothenoylcysteine decarboxylase / phosphopantothenate---cysteine ligase